VDERLGSYNLVLKPSPLANWSPDGRPQKIDIWPIERLGTDCAGEEKNILEA
jgi:hypothetical protein